MTAVISQILAQATPIATKGGTATAGAELPAAGFSLPLIILTTVGLIIVTTGLVKFFQAFKKF